MSKKDEEKTKRIEFYIAIVGLLTAIAALLHSVIDSSKKSVDIQRESSANAATRDSLKSLNSRVESLTIKIQGSGDVSQQISGPDARVAGHDLTENSTPQPQGSRPQIIRHEDSSKYRRNMPAKK